MCESIGHRPLRGRCPKRGPTNRPTDQLTDRPTDRPTDKAGCRVAQHATKKNAKNQRNRPTDESTERNNCVDLCARDLKNGYFLLPVIFYWLNGERENVHMREIIHMGNSLLLLFMCINLTNKKYFFLCGTKARAQCFFFFLLSTYKNVCV